MGFSIRFIRHTRVRTYVSAPSARRFDYFEPRYVSSPDTRRAHWQQAYLTSIEHFPPHPRHLLGPAVDRGTAAHSREAASEGFKQLVASKMAQMMCWECVGGGSCPTEGGTIDHDDDALPPPLGCECMERSCSGRRSSFDSDPARIQDGVRRQAEASSPHLSPSAMHEAQQSEVHRGGHGSTKGRSIQRAPSGGGLLPQLGLDWVGGAVWEGLVMRLAGVVTRHENAT